MKVAVIAFQGDVSEHIRITEKAMKEMGVEGEVISTRREEHLYGADAVILPGGESTAISKRLVASGLDRAIIKMAEEGRAVMGTCAGCVLMAKKGDDEVERTGTKLLGLMDIQVTRNAFGRQRESFETQLEMEGIGNIDAVFIRAPAITGSWNDCRIISRLEGVGVAAVQGKMMALSFHPELSGDARIHKEFLRMAGV